MQINSGKLYIQTDSGFVEVTNAGFNIFKANTITSGAFPTKKTDKIENESIDTVKTYSKKGDNTTLDKLGAHSKVTLRYTDGATNYTSTFDVANKITEEGNTYIEFVNTYEGTSKSSVGGGGGGVTQQYVDDQDAVTLASAKTYAKEQDTVTLTSAKTYTNEQVAKKQDKLPTVVNDRYLHTNATTGALEWKEVTGGGEPAAYIKNITQSDNTYTAAKKDGTTISWTVPVLTNYYTKAETNDKFLTKTEAYNTYADKDETGAAIMALEEAVADKSHVDASATGTSTNLIYYITIDGTEYKLAGASGNYVDLTTDQTIGGNKTFTNSVKVGQTTSITNVPSYSDWIKANPMPMTDDTSAMQAWVKASEAEKERIAAIQEQAINEIIYIDYGSTAITKHSGSTTDTALFKSEADTKYTTLDTAQTISGAKTFTTAVFVGSTEAGSSRATIEGNNIYISDGSSGDHVNINPTTIESNAEDFSIIVENGEYLSTLTMTAAGALTWKNKNVLTTDDIVDSITSTATDKALSAYSATKLLPLSGGTTTGAIVHSGTSSYALRQSTDDSYLKIAGGITDGKAASIFLYGGLETSNSGVAQIRTSTGTGWGPMLELKPGGSAKWNEKELMTGHLYQHTINCYYTGNTTSWWVMTIYSTSSTAFTTDTLATWLYNNGFVDQLHMYGNVTGLAANNTYYVSTTSGGSTTKAIYYPTIITGLYCTDGTWENVRTRTNFSGYYTWSSNTVIDTVVTII